jgi:hypothetical protein
MFRIIPLGNRQVKLEAKLKDFTGNPLPGKPISFSHKLSSDSDWTDDGTATTDDMGVASVVITVNTPDMYDFQAVFTGDSKYEASVAILENQIIKEKTFLSLKVESLSW